jgi:hypothetical protein
MMSEANGEDVVLDDWAKSKTKAILESMIIKGEIPDDDWPPACVYELKDELKKTHYKRNFFWFAAAQERNQGAQGEGQF